MLSLFLGETNLSRIVKMKEKN